MDYATADGTATAPGDYTAINGTLIFLNGETSKTVTLTPINDTTWEPSEAFTLTLSNPVDATLGVATATVTINDDDPRSAGTLALSSATATLPEGGPAITVTVDRTGGSDGTVAVEYATADGTAAAPGDYTAISGTLTFLDGELSKTLTLTPTGDTVWEPSEDFTLNLSNPVDATLGGQTSTTVTITDDDPRSAGTLALNSTTVTLPESGPAVIMTVNRTGGSDGTVMVDYATADGTATAPGDYTAISGTLIFLNGETSKTVTLTPINDTTWEPSEDFTLTLSNPVDASLGLATAAVTISDDDARTSGTLALSSATATLSESGPAITLTVDRTGGSDGTVSVDYATVDGTATAPGDYTAINGTLTFLDGELSKTLTLIPTGDTVWEPSETFTLILSNAVDASLGLATATVTITDDDTRNAGTLALNSTTVTLPESGPAVIMTVNRTGGSDGTVTVDYATSDGTATAPGDYTAISGTLTFLNGEASKTVTLTPINDTTWELSETFTLTLSNPVDATLGLATATVTVTDDDPRSAGTLDLSNAIATLSESGPAVMLTVDRTGGSDGTVSVDYATTDGTATAPGDYTAINGTLTFLDGELSKTLTLNPTGDTIWEPSETFTLSLSNPVDATLGLASATVTITDDDDGVAPVITIQEPVISVPSTGPFTSVDLGVVTALDDVDGVVTPVADLTGPFAPGRHLITWRAIDNSSNMATEVQTVDVLPMVNFGVDQVANPGSPVDIPVFLNGDAPEYPVVIDYQITDFDAAGGTVAQTAGSVNIAAGAVPSNQANIQYLIQNAGVAKVEVTLLNTGANATFGANNVHTINVNVTEMNLPPVVSITGSQNNTTTATVFADAGQVTVTAVVNDPNPADTHVYDWSQSDNGLALQFGAQPNTVVFDPSGLIEGVYKVVVSVTDFAGDTTTVDKSVRVRASALIFDDDGSDSDSDGVSDFDEGDEDEDEDGIPDYLDPHDDDYILAGQNGDPDDFLLITEPGLKLELSEEKIRDEDYSADLDEQEFIDRENSSGGGVGDPQDTHAHVGGIFEFEIEGLAYVGQSVRIVIPVHEAIPANAVYRLYTDDEGWHDFVVDDRNSVSSAPGELGICPAPGDVTYIAGLHEGHFCVQLLIEDGGRNDADGRANGEIEDPGGVAIVPTSTPTTPQTSSGGGGGIGGWLLVLLLGVWLRNIRRESMTGIRLSAVKLVGGGFRTLLLAGLLSAGMVSTVSSANGLLSLYEASADSVAATLKPDCAFHAQGEAADKEREFPTIVGGVRSEENQLRYRQVIASSKGYRRSEHNYRMPKRKLVSMDGQPTSLATELEGDKPVMLNFIFTTCTTICPVLSATFSQVRESLGAESRNVTMVSISIDPEYDTPERLNEYARLYGADDQWRFLTGRVEDIIAIEKAFDAYRGTKMSHEPLTFLRADGDSPWVRIEGIASADDIVKEYEQLVLR
ncbi:MAG: SCO family protein [gamma proteobacterium endosymbiont of Lamellibrachia anaximandri]|nr:SCO family protein [gamma proteobacterium endosymbiont of Lamellibrachia anaximandri]